MALTLDNDNTKDTKALKTALESGDSDTFVNAIVENANKNSQAIEEKILNEAKGFSIQNVNDDVLAKRGFAPLTAEEIKYYNEVKDTHSFADLELPKTVFERVFEDLSTNHPLLSKINFVNVTGITEWLVRVRDVEDAWWGPLCDEIKKNLDSAFKVEKTDLYKVSAYVPVCKAMLDLGPEWLDRYVRAILTESIALAMEKAILVGTGKDQPIGIFKKISEVSEEVHADKEAKALTEFTTKTIGTEILKPLRAGKVRPSGEIIMVVNDSDYYTHFFQVEYGQDRDGRYYEQKLPFNLTIIASPYAPEGKIAVGEAQNYWAGVGSELKIAHSDEFRFLDDQRVYVAKQYASGRARKDEDFIVFDITNLKVYPETNSVTPEA